MLAFHPLADTAIAALSGDDGSAVGSISGTCTVIGISGAIVKAEGTSAGIATVAGHSISSYYTIGSASGTATVSGISRRDVLPIQRKDDLTGRSVISNQRTFKLTA